jgi:hypothetical protein
VLLSSRHLALPSHKEFLVQVFGLPTADPVMQGTQRDKAALRP